MRGLIYFLVLIITFVLCVSVSFNLENMRPTITVKSECDTIIAGSAYRPEYELFDDNEPSDFLESHLMIWAESMRTGKVFVLGELVQAGTGGYSVVL